MTKFAVLASGRGSNFVAITDAIQNGKIPNSQLIGLLTHNENAGAIKEAEQRKIPTFVVRTPGADRHAYEIALEKHLDELAPDYICLAGYMRLLNKRLIERWDTKILNIHPSLLPSFPGLHGRRQALEHGVRWTGCTVHFVNENLDDGPILGQSVIEIMPGESEETLETKMLPLEHMLYVQVLKDLVSKKFRIEGRKVVWENHPKK